MRAAPAVLLLLLACATAEKPPPDARILEGVPFYEPGREHCGPAALASVLNYWHARTGNGRAIPREEIDAAIFSESAGGTLGIDLERFASAPPRSSGGEETSRIRGGAATDSRCRQPPLLEKERQE